MKDTKEFFLLLLSLLLLLFLLLARKKIATRYMRSKTFKIAWSTCRIKNQQLRNPETLQSFCGTCVYVVSHVFFKQFWKASYLSKFPLAPILFIFSFIAHLQGALSLKMGRNCNLELSLFHPSPGSDM